MTSTCGHHSLFGATHGRPRQWFKSSQSKDEVNASARLVSLRTFMLMPLCPSARCRQTAHNTSSQVDSLQSRLTTTPCLPHVLQDITMKRMSCCVSSLCIYHYSTPSTNCGYSAATIMLLPVQLHRWRYLQSSLALLTPLAHARQCAHCLACRKIAYAPKHSSSTAALALPRI